MAISFVGGGSGALSTSDVTYNFSSLLDSGGGTPTLQQNDIVIVSIAYRTTAVWNRQPTGYTSAYANIYEDATTSDLNLKTSYKFMGASPDTSVVIPASQNRGCFTVHVLRGVDTTTPLDGVTPTTTGAANAIANPDPPSITPSTSGAWVYCVGGITTTASSPITNSADLSSTTNLFQAAVGTSSTSSIGAGLKTDWSSGAFNAAAFGGGQSVGSGGWAAVSLILKPAATTATGVGTSSGTATISGAGKAKAKGAGTSVGTATPSAVGKATSKGAGSASGASTVSGVGKATGKGVGTSAGVGAVSGAGKALVASVGAASGAATVSGIGKGSTPGVGTASGSSTASGQGKAFATGVGLSDGLGVVVGEGSSIAIATGTASGTSTVGGVSSGGATIPTPSDRIGHVERGSRSGSVSRLGRTGTVSRPRRVA